MTKTEKKWNDYMDALERFQNISTEFEMVSNDYDIDYLSFISFDKWAKDLNKLSDEIGLIMDGLKEDYPND